LIPTRAVIEREEQVRYKALNIEDVLQTLERAKTRMNILILDACRNNPYERKFRSTGGRGLAIVSPPAGTIIAYATAAGSVASDGEGNNGLYTQSLAQALRIPGLRVEDVFKEAKREVGLQSHNLQRPAEYSDITEDFYFLAPSSANPIPITTARPTPKPVQTPVSLATSSPTPRPTERPVESSDEVRNSLGMKYRLIPAGTFLGGSPDDEAGRFYNESSHQVSLTEPFYMQTTEVTQGQWEAVMGTNPSNFKGDIDLPVEQVSWEDVQGFISRLNSRGDGTYRLPSEAEWEYAARARSRGPYACGASCLDDMGWYDENSGNKTHPVAQKSANAWGLYDMHGNVSEWAQDWFGDYSTASQTNPRGAGTGWARVIRGGNWNSSAKSARSAFRGYVMPDISDKALGFRLVRMP
ncbi:MAG: SUMF1/EgtB/PvdO family nonheme iron enzyme, partial [Candidatus Sericytochromatia bacterium]